MSVLKLELLDPAAFAPFGDVIQMDGSAWFHINGGTTRRYHDLGRVDVRGDDGQGGISMARGDAFRFPLRIAMLERHPLGSQAWIPCNRTPFVAVVAPNGPDNQPDESAIRAFYVRADQGVNYHLGTWHHPLMSLGQQGDFIVVDRIGTAPNCDECELQSVRIVDGSFLNGRPAESVLPDGKAGRL
ncbi:MAG TPA: ureidoglycolate lyase [Pusillimonas sp.]|uniref:ureidoglycolate lyase n=1 Tax=Pusillimonas sp. TaxID=3040095 RepID=UPI002B72186B|nr:ureidoglycolate lyase [Pusillimonas sp.]HUH87397.1 ureidoglycolate lyase [Pusillimonas sp.]